MSLLSDVAVAEREILGCLDTAASVCDGLATVSSAALEPTPDDASAPSAESGSESNGASDRETLGAPTSEVGASPATPPAVDVTEAARRYMAGVDAVEKALLRAVAESRSDVVERS